MQTEKKNNERNRNKKQLQMNMEEERGGEEKKLKYIRERK